MKLPGIVSSEFPAFFFTLSIYNPINRRNVYLTEKKIFNCTKKKGWDSRINKRVNKISKKVVEEAK